MKVAPIHRLMIERAGFEPVLVHTGQHYDARMSKVFFGDLGMSEPDVYLGVGSASHAEQTARVMVEFEKICLERRPDWVLVVGDVNSTIACALVASKLGIRVAHVEAGLRSWDRSMPEEINRILTDAISDLLFVHSPEAVDNLRREGVAEERIHLVGNVMIDSLVNHLEAAEKVYRSELAGRFPDREYGLVTLHRPSNVDDSVKLNLFLAALERLSLELPLIFPIHPRTRARLADNGGSPLKRLELVEPMGYLEFLGVMKHARLVVTDSGGVQEETSFLNVPCVTARDNTERPITVELGSNVLAGSDPEAVYRAALEQLKSPRRAREIPLWDGRAAERVVGVLAGVGV
jgi:UDP-N-acetylglucosamine 2-epimerase (non-hydrolysing)